MKAISNGLGCGKRGTVKDRANRTTRIPMRFSPKFITYSSLPGQDWNLRPSGNEYEKLPDTPPSIAGVVWDGAVEVAGELR